SLAPVLSATLHRVSCWITSPFRRPRPRATAWSSRGGASPSRAPCHPRARRSARRARRASTIAGRSSRTDRVGPDDRSGRAPSCPSCPTRRRRCEPSAGHVPRSARRSRFLLGLAGVCGCFLIFLGLQGFLLELAEANARLLAAGLRLSRAFERLGVRA